MNLKLKIILISLLMSGVDVTAQRNLYFDYYNVDSKVVLDTINSIKYSNPNKAISLSFEALEYYMDQGPSPVTISIYNILGEVYSKKNLPVLALSYFTDAVLEFELTPLTKRKDQFVEKPPWILINLGNIYFNEGQILKAMEKYSSAELNFGKLNDDLVRNRGLATTYNNMALVNIEMGKFKEALDLLDKALSIRQRGDKMSDIAHSYKSMCELYYKWNIPKKALKYEQQVDSLFQFVRNHPEFSLDNSDWTASMDYSILKSYVGNCSEYKGDYYLVIEDYEKAVEAYTYAESFYDNWPFQLTKMLNNKSLALLGFKEFKEASMINYNVINLSKENDLSKELERALQIKLQILDEGKNYSNFTNKVDSLVNLLEDRYSSQISQLLSGIEIKNEIFLGQRKNEEQESFTQKIILISIIIILILGFLTAYFISRKVYIEKQVVIANQNEKLATSDLEHKKRELAMLSTNIVQENELMSSILKDLRYYVSLLKTPKDQKLFVPLINSLNRSLNDKRKDDNYSDQFSAAYPGYLEYLTRTYSELSTSDLKLCTFLRMNLNTKEIAEIMGLSVRSVESRRYRLRKKIKLSKDQDLVSFLIKLDY